MSAPEKPTLNQLRGDLYIDTSTRETLQIPDGFLCGEIKHYKDCNKLVKNFFINCDAAATFTYDSFVRNIVESLKRIEDIKGDDKKTQLLSGFAGRVKNYITHPEIDKMMKREFNKTLRKIIENEEQENLRDEGKIHALVIAQNQSIALQESERENSSRNIPPQRQQPEVGESSIASELESGSGGKRKSSLLLSSQTPKHQRSGSPANDFQSLEFLLPNRSRRYIVGGFDVSRHFHDFQLSLKNREVRFNLESHVQHIMAVSSILLLKPSRMNEDLVKVFGSDKLDLIFNDTKERLGIQERDLPIGIIARLIPLVEKVKSKTITRTAAVAKLLEMEEEVDSKTFKVIKSIANIILKVPKTSIMETVKESELCTRYLDPLLCGLFDDTDADIYFRWTNERPNEVKESKGGLSNERPDAVISLLNGIKWSKSFGFIEAKCSGESNNNYLISMDLVRLGVFSKMSLDTNSLKGALSLQVVGNSIIFYITTDSYDHIYIMYEIAEVHVPSCLDEVSKYLMDFNKLYNIVDLFERWCQSDAPHSENHSQSPSTNNICALISPSTNRSRPCITKHNYR